MYKFVKRENFRQKGGLGWKSSLWRQLSIFERMVLPTFKNLWRKSYMTYLYMPWPFGSGVTGLIKPMQQKGGIQEGHYNG